jgi:hypothetical protein
MAEGKEDLLKLVNASGFLFQLRVEDEVNKTSSKHHKTVLAREHRWVDPVTQNEGFIDLILTTGTNGRMVLECKRVIDANWIFPVPVWAKVVTHANILWSYKIDENRQVAAWDKLELYPESLESSFCIVRGQGEKDKPMLERIASILLRSTECLAEEEEQYPRSPGLRGIRFYFPIIVTTAKLMIFRYSPSNIDLSSGQIPDGEFQEVPFLRFTKSMSTRLSSSKLPTTLPESARESQRTVFVMNADSLSTSLLDLWEFDQERNTFPWDVLE